jgi:hypothetical protein
MKSSPASSGVTADWHISFSQPLLAAIPAGCLFWGSRRVEPRPAALQRSRFPVRLFQAGPLVQTNTLLFRGMEIRCGSIRSKDVFKNKTETMAVFVREFAKFFDDQGAFDGGKNGFGLRRVKSAFDLCSFFRVMTK